MTNTDKYPVTIVVSLKTIYKNVTDWLFEMNVLDIGDEDVQDWELLDAFKSPDHFRTELRDGGTMLLFQQEFDKIESYNRDKIPFTIAVMLNNQVWGVFKDSDLFW